MAGKINGIEVNECKELPVKTEDEIKKYEIQENLSDVDKALLLLSKSNFSQKLSVHPLNRCSSTYPSNSPYSNQIKSSKKYSSIYNTEGSATME
jgi:hypothetical protein